MTIWHKKSIEELLAFENQVGQKLNRSLNAFDLMLLGIGAIVGAGLFSITGIAAAENAGPAIILSFILAAVACGFCGLCYSEFAAMIPISGSAYTYAYATLGQLWAWIIGWDLILEYAIGAAAVSISWSAYIVSLLHDLGLSLPHQIVSSPWQPTKLSDGTMVQGWINLPALFIVIATSWLLIVGVRRSASANAVMVLIKIAVIFIFIGLGIFYINPDNFVPFIPENKGNFGEFGWSGVLRAAGVVFFAYIGFDAVSTAAQETKNPQKNVPIGLMGSLVVCTILYIAFSTVMVGLVKYTELDVAAPAAVAIAKTPFDWIEHLVSLAILAGLTSVILVTLYGQSRIFYVMAKDGLLPKALSEVHPTYQTPWKTNLILMTFVGAVSAFAPLGSVGHMTSIGTLLAFVIVSTSILVLRARRPDIPRPFRTPWVPFVPIAGIFCCLVMMLSLGWENWMRLGVWLLIGLFIYGLYGRHAQKRETPSL